MEEERIRKKKTRSPFHLPPPSPTIRLRFQHTHTKSSTSSFFFFLFFHQWPNTFCRFRFDNFISDGGWNRKEKKIKKIKKIKKERGKKKTNKQKKKLEKNFRFPTPPRCWATGGGRRHLWRSIRRPMISKPRSKEVKKQRKGALNDCAQISGNRTIKTKKLGSLLSSYQRPSQLEWIPHKLEDGRA